MLETIRDDNVYLSKVVRFIEGTLVVAVEPIVQERNSYILKPVRDVVVEFGASDKVAELTAQTLLRVVYSMPGAPPDVEGTIPQPSGLQFAVFDADMSVRRIATAWRAFDMPDVVQPVIENAVRQTGEIPGMLEIAPAAARCADAGEPFNIVVSTETNGITYPSDAVRSASGYVVPFSAVVNLIDSSLARRSK